MNMFHFCFPSALLSWWGHPNQNQNQQREQQNGEEIQNHWWVPFIKNIFILLQLSLEHNLTIYLLFLTVDQTTDIILYSADKYTKTVFTQEISYVLKIPNKKKHRNPHTGVTCLLTELCFNGFQGDGGAQQHLWENGEHHAHPVWQQGEKRVGPGWQAEGRGHKLGLHHHVSASREKKKKEFTFSFNLFTASSL